MKSFLELHNKVNEFKMFQLIYNDNFPKHPCDGSSSRPHSAVGIPKAHQGANSLSKHAIGETSRIFSTILFTLLSLARIAFPPSSSREVGKTFTTKTIDWRKHQISGSSHVSGYKSCSLNSEKMSRWSRGPKRNIARDKTKLWAWEISKCFRFVSMRQPGRATIRLNWRSSDALIAGARHDHQTE